MVQCLPKLISITNKLKICSRKILFPKEIRNQLFFSNKKETHKLLTTLYVDCSYHCNYTSRKVSEPSKPLFKVNLDLGIGKSKKAQFPIQFAIFLCHHSDHYIFVFISALFVAPNFFFLSQRKYEYACVYANHKNWSDIY